METFMFPKGGHFLPGQGASGNRVRTNHFTFSLCYFFLLTRNNSYSQGMIDKGNSIRTACFFEKIFSSEFLILMGH